MCGCIYGRVRSLTVAYGLLRSCTIANTIIHGHGTRVRFLKVLKIIRAFTETLDWPECNSDKAQLVRLYVRFTRMANRLSRVFCVRQALRLP